MRWIERHAERTAQAIANTIANWLFAHIPHHTGQAVRDAYHDGFNDGWVTAMEAYAEVDPDLDWLLNGSRVPINESLLLDDDEQLAHAT